MNVFPKIILVFAIQTGVHYQGYKSNDLQFFGRGKYFPLKSVDSTFLDEIGVSTHNGEQSGIAFTLHCYIMYFLKMPIKDFSSGGRLSGPLSRTWVASTASATYFHHTPNTYEMCNKSATENLVKVLICSCMVLSK